MSDAPAAPYARDFPVVWVIGATRSCKTAIAENGVAPLGFTPISTATYFREHYAQPDTMNRAFVFNISAHAADMLEADPDCHTSHLGEILRKIGRRCVVEGERNPVEFAKHYNPKRDMVIFANRLDVDKYDTVIERGIAVIEQQVRWCVSTGAAPQESAFKMTFGDLEITGARFGYRNAEDEVFIHGPVKAKGEGTAIEDRYPWINILIGLVRHEISDYYKLRAPAQASAPRQAAASKPAFS